MGTKTDIEWTDYTSNPIKFKRKSDGKRGWACVKVSQGCKFCYAERWNGWRGTGQDFSVAGMAQMEPYLDQKELNWLLKSKNISGKCVFIEDMSDLFGEWVPFEWINQLFAVFRLRQDVTFQVLTKRMARAIDWYGHYWHYTFPTNVWMGTSVEDQNAANERVPLLLSFPAKWRFLSCEPLLGPVDLTKIPYVREGVVVLSNFSGATFIDALRGYYYGGDRVINWVIVGGESGTQARPMHPDWARSIRGQCVENGVAFFFKQWGEWAPVDQLAWVTNTTTFSKKPLSLNGTMMAHVGKGKAGYLLDGVEWRQMPSSTDLSTDSSTDSIADSRIRTDEGQNPLIALYDDPFSRQDISEEQKADLLDWFTNIDLPKPKSGQVFIAGTQLKMDEGHE